MDILTANRVGGAADEMQKSIDASKNEDNIIFLKTVLEKAVVDGNLGRNTKDTIIKSVTEASGKRTGSCLGDRSIFGHYYSYYFKSILPFLAFQEPLEGRKAEIKETQGKRVGCLQHLLQVNLLRLLELLPEMMMVRLYFMADHGPRISFLLYIDAKLWFHSDSSF